MSGAIAGRRVRPGLPLLLATLLVLPVLLVASSASPAAAHAVLTGASPSNGESLEVAPSEVRLTFNEPVTTGDGALRVFDQDGERVDAGAIDGTDPSEVAVALPDGLADGAYVAAYRVVSADSHPIAGTITFTVGDVAALDAESIARIAGPTSSVVGVLGSLLRGAGYLGTLLAAGAVLFAAVVARGQADRRRAASVGRPAALVGIVVTVLHLPVQAAAVSGYGLLSVLTEFGVLRDVLTSSFGQSAVVRVAALAALAVPWFVARPAPDAASDASPEVATGRSVGTRRPLVWLGVAAAVALGSYLLDGHQRTVSPTWLLVGGDAVHLAGAAAWFGGLVLLLVTLRRTRLDDDPVGAATVIARFSRLAFWSVLALGVAGVAMALPLVRSLEALTSTGYGWTLVAKVGLVAVALAVAAYNRRQLVPHVTARLGPEGADATATAAPAWAALGRAVRVEVVIVGVVLGLTGFLVTTQPAAEAAGLTGPTMVTEPLTDELRLDLVITPSEPGLNTVHVYVLEPSGQPSAEVEGVRLEFTYLDQDIGPFPVEPFVAGPGHWVATIEDLRFAGGWEIRIVGGLGRFDEVDLTIPFTIS